MNISHIVETAKWFIPKTLLLGFVSLASAAELNPATGKLERGDSQYFNSMEPQTNDLNISIYDSDWHSLPATDVAARFKEYKQGIEGSGYWQIGGNIDHVAIGLGNQMLEFDGRRVEIKLWYKPQGTHLSASIVWMRDNTWVGNVKFHPTGRGSDDGWRELSSGPIDFSLGGLIVADHLYLENLQNRTLNRSNYSRAPDANVAIDALEIFDLGPAIVPVAQCSTIEAKAQCGQQGSCYLGQCVDSAFAWGQIPPANLIDDYIERRKFEVNTFEGIRFAQSQMTQFNQTMNTAKQAHDGESFWRTIQSAWQVLQDGHSIAPVMSQNRQINSGLCLNQGEADLLPTSGESPVPMLFSKTQTPFSQLLKPGDVIVDIDGLTPKLWMQQSSIPNLQLAGDRGSLPTQHVNYLNYLLPSTGAKVTFARCSDPQGCANEQQQTFEIDFADVIGNQIWQGNIQPWLSDESFCDVRFKPDFDINYNNASFLFDVLDKSENNITSVLFNQFFYPAAYPQWSERFSQIFSVEQDKILFDHRLGMGGSPTGLHYLLDFLIEDASFWGEMLYPWFEVEDESDELANTKQCTQSPTQNSCGRVEAHKVGVQHENSTGVNAKIALLTGIGVSASDFFTRVLTERQAQFRIFGPSPLMGAYGYHITMSPLLDEPVLPRVQTHDTAFLQLPNAPLVFEKGKGVTPHEIVFQKQSDAILNRDTQLEAAKAWLNQ